MVCGALLCENCQMIVGSTEGDLARESGRLPGGYGSFGPVYHAACTRDCFDRWAWSFISGSTLRSASGPGTSSVGSGFIPPRPNGPSRWPRITDGDKDSHTRST